jgi:RNA polymerase sigma-70 factor, ECF subfamily
MTMSDFARRLEQQIPQLRQYARTLARDAAAADDLVQSCLVRALGKQHLWQPGTDLHAWLFTMLHNLHVDHVRRAVHAQESALAVSVSLAGAQVEPGARLELWDLDRAIGKLPEWQRQVILLVGLDGLRYAEAAAVLGIGVGTVRSRIGRARASLRRLIGGETGTRVSSHGSPSVQFS